MFTVYIDDSGTDPKQQVAIASALIVPAKKIPALDKEWAKLLKNEGFSSLHCSELAAVKSKASQFVGWDQQKKKRVLRRARQITMKYGVRAFSIAVNKSHYDEFVPSELRDLGGKYHYTWGIRFVIDWLDRWASSEGIEAPFEYIFDWMGDDKRNRPKAEIHTVMAQAEFLRPGRYQGHYAFRHRADTPALQCADLLAWSCYTYALHVMVGGNLARLPEKSFEVFRRHKNEKWLTAIGQKKEQLKRWAEKELNDPRSQKRRKEWKESRTITPL
jgi:Protein of unknown function (DUF3800)